MAKDFSNVKLNISYDSGNDDILWDFYIPVLSLANQYDRIAGFFSSTSLSLAARGMEDFILNGGKMRLVTCPLLSQADVGVIKQSVDKMESVLFKNFVKDYSDIETQFQKDHVKALGWMLANNKLEIKIAVIKKDGKICTAEEIDRMGIMHQKVGIFYDQSGNVISFSGSNNESASGWLGNTEEFKVFCSWKGANDYIREDQKKFNSFWNSERVEADVIELPKAVEKLLIQEGNDFKPEKINVKKYYPKTTERKKEELKLFYYQEEAVQTWENNKRSLLLQMATGCGKTRTAIGCLQNALKDTNKLLTVIACPQVTLAAQWKADIDNLDVKINHAIELNGGVKGWLDKFKKEILKLSAGRYKNLVVYTTHQICSSQKFIDVLNSSSDKITKFLIGDEVHGLGAAKTKNGLLDLYNYRLGLSATPQRWFDDSGSKLIEDFFGNASYEFTIDDALKNHNPLTGKPFLVNYEYHPVFINLTDDELEEYRTLTKKIARMSGGRKGSDRETIMQMLLFKRANLEKNAFEKYEALENLIDEIGEDISDTIIFVSDEQIDNVMKMLGDKGIDASRFTQEQGTTKQSRYNGLSEREHIIKLFKEGKYQVLVAIKCLDEGIDIPSAKRGIVMASSTNPREYVQRTGRIIRQAPDKTQAYLYDMIIKPDMTDFREDDIAEMENKIFRKEMDRVIELAQSAINNSTVINMVYNILRENM